MEWAELQVDAARGPQAHHFVNCITRRDGHYLSDASYHGSEQGYNNEPSSLDMIINDIIMAITLYIYVFIKGQNKGSNFKVTQTIQTIMGPILVTHVIILFYTHSM